MVSWDPDVIDWALFLFTPQCDHRYIDLQEEHTEDGIAQVRFPASLPYCLDLPIDPA